MPEMHSLPFKSDDDDQRLYARTKYLSKYIPEVDPNHPRAQTTRTSMSKRSNMLKIQFALITAISILNISIASWAMKTHPKDSVGIGTFFIGNCSTTNTVNSGLHAALNVLSSLALGVGNYCMQISVAPSRDEVEESHRKGTALEIGVLSFHNLWHIKGRRVAQWFFLGTIATLLHLLWNSAIFPSIPMVAYPMAIVTSDFQQSNDDWSTSYLEHTSSGRNLTSVYSLQHEASSTVFTKLSPRECIEQYIDPMRVTSSLIVVTSNYTTTQNNGSSILRGMFNGGDNSDLWSMTWICDAYHKPNDDRRWCTIKWADTFSDEWYVVGHNLEYPRELVDYCLVGEAGNNLERCGLHYSAYIMIIVCFCTVGEAVAVFFVWRAHSRKAENNYEARLQERTMVTTGDAIANFLERPNYLYSKASTKSVGIVTEMKEWPQSQISSWFSAVSVKVWVISLTLFATGIMIPVILLSVHMKRLGSKDGLFNIWKRGFKVTSGQVFDSPLGQNTHDISSIIRSVLFANIFQLMVSFLYIFYNNIFTRQLVADEWMRFIKQDYSTCSQGSEHKPLLEDSVMESGEQTFWEKSQSNAEHKKPLRVSSPVGLQRSSYTLSLPLTYSIPLMTASTFLHWLVSQSLFVVQTIVFSTGPNAYRIPDHDTSRNGCSILGIILSIILGLFLVIALLINSFLRKYPNGPREFPALAINSAAISAVCQRPQHDEDAHLFHVSLGVVDGQLTFSTHINLQTPHARNSTESGTQYPVIFEQESRAHRCASRALGFFRLTTGRTKIKSFR